MTSPHEKLGVHGVSQTFASKNGKHVEALKNVSLSVKDREFVAVVGPSGCGKSTLLHIAAGLLAPTQGYAELNGTKISRPGREQGMVFQRPAPFPWLTVEKNVEFGMMLHKIAPEMRKEQAKSYLDLVGLSGFESSWVSSLSGGMSQRVALATVLANNPEILLMDEPFSSLDTQTRALMQELVLHIWEKTKKAVLFMTHDIEEAIFLADRLYVMSSRPGEIKEEVAINVPRPRSAAVKFTTPFLEIKKHITYLIRNETIKAAQIRGEMLGTSTLKVGLPVWPGNIPFYLAESLGLYEKYNLRVDLVSLEKDKTDRFDALRSDAVDILNMTADGLLLAKAAGMDIQSFVCLNRSDGGDALIAAPHIKSVSDLRGKTIALEKGWVSHSFLLYILAQRTLAEKDVRIVHMRGADIGSAMIRKQVDAAVLWEPWLTQAINLSGSTILVSTKDEPVIMDVLAAKKGTLFEKAESIEAFIRIWYETLAYMQDNKDKVEKLMTVSFPFGLSLGDLLSQLSSIHFITREENTTLLRGQGAPALSKLLDDFSSILLKNNTIKHPITGTELINTSFCK